MITLLASLLLLDPPAGKWVALPLVSKEMRARGLTGGEGAQWPRSLAFDATGKRALLGIDVGGIYRSMDGGRNWEPANIGYSPRGCAGIAFDPGNSDRILVVGGNTAPGGHHGLYLSTNGAASWRSVFAVNMAGIEEMREQIGFDRSTYDAVAKKTTLAYWSRVINDHATWGTPEEHPAIYKSTDGGEKWTEIPGTAAYAGGILRVSPGRILTGRGDGVFASTNGGKSFVKLLSGEITGIDVSPRSQQLIWVSTPNSILQSKDGGKNWAALSSPAQNGFSLRNLKVSPVDVNRMVLWRQQNDGWDWSRYASADGGKTWTRANLDWSDSFLPANSRQGIFAWDPKIASKLLSIGVDFASLSLDGGFNYRYSNSGNNAVLVGGMFNFTAKNPDLIAFGSQDYNGAVTQDAGLTWKYLNPSGNGWGGFCYAGYAINDKTMFVGNAAGWGSPRILRVSDDAGATWRDTGITLDGPDTSMGDPRDLKVAFAKNYRTADTGKTWKRMVGCDGVFTASSGRDGTLFGVRGNDVVISSDSGVTWTLFAKTTGDIRDLAYEVGKRRLYAVIGDSVQAWTGKAWEALPIPKNQFNWYSPRTVATDAKGPGVVYVGSAGNIFNSSVGLVRSVDSGKTWSVITRQPEYPAGEKDGGREALCVRVHPRTREVYVSTSCYGIWKWVPKL